MSLWVYLLVCASLVWTEQMPFAQRPQIPAIPNAPFSAVAVIEVTTPTKTLVSKKYSIIARDSKGATYREEHAFLMNGETGLGRVVSIEISDPAAGSTTLLNPATMEATSAPFFRPLPVPPPPPARPSDATQNEPSSEIQDLGISTMEGLAVHGTRQTTNGFAGERWFSEELKLVVKQQYRDLHVEAGLIRSITLTQVSRGEPDARLFEVPANYKTVSAPKLIHIDAKASDANLITRVEPEYPELARSANVQGEVEFTATVGPDGRVKNLQLVRGHPLLVTAARDAVLQWKYRPTLLNGVPVTVVVSAVVKFRNPP